MKIIDTQRQWATVCVDCPADGNNPDDGKTWEFPACRDGLKQAERFAVRHRALRGHNVHLMNRVTMTFNLYDNPGLQYLLGLGDAGDNIGLRR